MNENQKIFEEYNVESAVKRCPNGRAPMKKLLDKFAGNTTALYGAISLEDFVDLFNQFHEEQTTIEETKIILLPIILKSRKYAFYKDYLIEEYFLENMAAAQLLIEAQANKPLYVPSAEVFTNFNLFETIFPTAEVEQLEAIFFSDFKYKAAKDYDKFNQLLTICLHDFSLERLDSFIAEEALEFETSEASTNFINLVIDVANNTRIWENKGHTPAELAIPGKLKRTPITTEKVATKKTN